MLYTVSSPRRQTAPVSDSLDTCYLGTWIKRHILTFSGTINTQWSFSHCNAARPRDVLLVLQPSLILRALPYRIHDRMQRLWNIIILLLFACAHVAASSPQAPLLVRLGLRGSKIPQFVHDLDHPWINENMGVLEQLNATEALCNAESPLRSRLPTIPDDLFKDLKVDNHDYSMRKRLGWDNARDRLLEIRSCKEALRTCQRFRVDIYRHAGGYDDKWEPQEPPQDVPPTFSDVLSSMPSLQKLEWMQPSDDTSATAIFESSFRERQLMLPTVTELQLGPNMHFLVPMAPNVETLTTSSGYKWPFPWHLNLRHELIDAARGAKHLTYFEMRADWDADLVRRVLDAMPQLQTLRLEGSMEDLYHFESGLHAPQGCRLTVRTRHSLTPQSIPGLIRSLCT